ncbi:hypothetical protein P378_16500 [Desulforamulus profundi]|uniref:Uncharacterized protein n=1 Tax=Desulforamulus profundi TaxID=1383067 RepID=A0A2C6MDX8_9FIRM|nr:hypothetical protein [Desulforamulus profundi]PHJ37506.1 hypothetical protein P378_16500 [Desulforamulus profundi]
MKPQQECITAYVFPEYIFLLPNGHPSRPKIEELFKEMGIRKHRLWGRKTKIESQHYIETGVWGSYETVGIKDRTLDGKPIPLFGDTELKEQSDSICLERHMIVGGKKFAVSSVFPKAAASLPTDKLLSLIDKELEKERKSF